jgi:hypothetical protein
VKKQAARNTRNILKNRSFSMDIMKSTKKDQLSIYLINYIPMAYRNRRKFNSKDQYIRPEDEIRTEE